MQRMLSAAFAASTLTISAPAVAAVPPLITTTVTASNANFGGSLASLNDGVSPANGSAYNAAGEVFFGSGEFNGSPASFTFTFDGLYSVESLLATVDNNDNYDFTFFNGLTQVGQTTIFSGQGTVTNGVETFLRDATNDENIATRMFPFLATSVRVTANTGDFRYALGEVQFRGNAVTTAVPEPASWAMMLVGFGAIGLSMRRKRKPVLATA